MASELEDRIVRLHRECEQAVEQQRWADALRGFEQLLPILEQAADRAGQGIVHIRIGQLYESAGDPDRARRHYLTAQMLGEQWADHHLQATALHRLAHLVRLRDARRARALFEQCLDLGAADQECLAVSLAMIGQIDFTEGDELGGLEKMLAALQTMPPAANSFEHLVEHIGYFGTKIAAADYQRLVTGRISNEALQQRLLHAG